jgi:hypothetical protein
LFFNLHGRLRGRGLGLFGVVLDCFGIKEGNLKFELVFAESDEGGGSTVVHFEIEARNKPNFFVLGLMLDDHLNDDIFSLNT